MTKKFIKIMTYSYKYSNFSSLRVIHAALEQGSIWRLKAMWAKILQDKKINEEYQKLKELLSPAHNYRTYRARLIKANPPCLPYLGQLLSDLTSIEESYPDYLAVSGRNDIINLDKMHKISNVIQQMSLYQQHRYTFVKSDVIYHFFSNKLHYFSEQQCFAKSRELEPPLVLN